MSSADEQLHDTIKRLVDEERSLAGDAEEPAERAARRRQIEAQLDQAWDLLRQREALREAGRNPDDAEPRAVGEVESYLQ
jgi:hypothetical protein